MKEDFFFERVEGIPRHAALTELYRGWQESFVSLLRVLGQSEVEISARKGELTSYMRQLDGLPYVVGFGSARDMNPMTREPIVSETLRGLLSTVFMTLVSKDLSLATGCAESGYMGALLDAFRVAVEKCPSMKSKKIFVPLGLNQEYRAKEPLPQSYLTGGERTIICPEVHDLNLRWLQMVFGNMLLAYFVTPGGIGTLKEFVDALTSHQLHAATLTPMSYKSRLNGGFLSADLFPRCFVFDDYVERQSSLLRGRTINGWFHEYELMDLLLKADYGTVSLRDLNQIVVIRITNDEKKRVSDLNEYPDHLKVVYFNSNEEAAAYIVEELIKIYLAKKDFYTSVRNGL